MWPAAMWSDAPISKKSSCRCASNGVAFCLSAAWPTPSGVASVGVRVCDAVSLAAAGGDSASPVLPLFFPLPSSSSYFLLLFWADTHHRGACERRTRGFPGAAAQQRTSEVPIGPSVECGMLSAVPLCDFFALPRESG